eukprot:940945-Pleurochrysis_carterae.AAC.1
MSPKTIAQSCIRRAQACSYKPRSRFHAGAPTLRWQRGSTTLPPYARAVIHLWECDRSDVLA